MIIFNLQEQLDSLLPKAEKVWIAAALAKRNAIEDLIDLLDEQSVFKILVGVDLPTPIDALKYLKEVEEQNPFVRSGIYYDHVTTFHPKLYIIEISGTYIAFVGSANLTDGGLQNNVELTYKIDNQPDCIQLLSWFDECFAKSYPIDEHNIEQYILNRIVSKPVVKSKIPFKRRQVKIFGNILDSIDFSDRYFKKEEHYAFREENFFKNTQEVIEERKLAEYRFRLLDSQILPSFEQYGLLDLHPNANRYLVSVSQSNDTAPRKINAMWLSYGKSPEEVRRYQNLFDDDKESRRLQTFIHHARLQVRIELVSIGIWILFGKTDGSSFDREFFRSEMIDTVYRKRFYTLCQSLPDEYWIKINEVKRNFSSFDNEDRLHDFCKTDRISTYFIIGRDYKITDTEMSDINLPLTVLTEFKRMHPIFTIMKKTI